MIHSLTFKKKVKLFIIDFLFFITPKSLIKRFFEFWIQKWIFIIGCNNSGTTVLNEVLKGHKEISGMDGEGQYRTNELRDDRSEGVGRLYTERIDIFRNPNSNIEKLKFDWFIFALGNRKNILEKTTVNSVRIDWIRQNFFPSYFIIIIRSPYAVIEGMMRKANIPLERATEHWIKNHEIIKNDTKNLNNYIQFTYDQFVEDTNLILEKIGTDLHLTEKFNISKDKHYKVQEKESKILNMDTLSISRLSPKQIEYINFKCSHLMKDFGLKLVEK